MIEINEQTTTKVKYPKIGEFYKRPISDEDIEDMIKLRKEGCSYSEIGAMYGMTEGTVYKRIKRYKGRVAS